MIEQRNEAMSGLPFIDAAAIERVATIPALITKLRRAFAGGVVAPARQSYDLPGDATLLTMPAWRENGDTGIKIVNVQPHASPSVRAIYILIRARDGSVRAILDGAMLTARRTAAASALAADFLARPDARTLLMLGTGSQAPHLIEAHCSVRPIERVLIWGRDPGKAQLLAADVARTGIEARAVTSHLDALPLADIISAATLSTLPLIEGERIKAGAHIDLVGAFRPDMCEADPHSFQRARVFVDTREGALHEAGDLLQAMRAGALQASDIEAELSELCAGKHSGRAGDSEAVTLFKSVGTSIEDLAAAEFVMDALEAPAHA